MEEVLGGGEVWWLSERCKEVWEGVTVNGKCYSNHRDV